MNVTLAPGYAAFRSAYDAGRGSLVWRRGVADLETPVAAYLKLAHGRPNAFLLESVEGGTTRGRYSVIGMAPDLIWRCQDGKAAINRSAHSAPHAFVPEARPPLESLRALINETRLDVPSSLPPMAGGLVGYLGYDMVRLMERLPDKNADVIGVPEGLMTRPSLFAIFDNVNDELTLVAPVYPSPEVSADAAWAAAQGRLDDAETALERPLPRQPPPVMLPDPPAPVSNFTREGFLAAVARCKDYIMAGDAFQIVISQRFAVPFVLPPFALYRSLRRVNPAPFMVYLDFGTFSVVASSPEVLVRLRDGTVTIRPLAGTRRRGVTREEDLALEQQLLSDPKERAEHLMLLDLGRNDVGRVAALGSVKVTEQFVIERFSHVMHISSNVEGRLAEGLDALDALIGGFPAGTLSGAPKVRAMEIIEELEPDRRGMYAGCIGYFAANGTMDTCIALRTALVKDGTMYVQAGAGIVADSDPDSEFDECRQKALALVRSAEEAVRFAAGKGGEKQRGVIARDAHLFGPGPKRILALDGGGIRGIISLAYLERLQAILRERFGPDTVLADYFDLIGGASTGAIIATGLALGLPVERLIATYLDLADRGFRRSSRFAFFAPKFQASALLEQIRAQVGDITLGSAKVKTGLAIIAKRIDTGSMWVFHNNPRGRWYDVSGSDPDAVPNKDLKLTQLIRASTAAPSYFAPESIEIAHGISGTFVDGAVSPHGNPGLLLFLLATLGGYGFRWPTGPGQLLLASVGTGHQPMTPSRMPPKRAPPLLLAAVALKSVMDDCNWLNQTLLQYLGHSPVPWHIDSEIGDLSGDQLGSVPAFHYLRYDMVYSSHWFDGEIGVRLEQRELDGLTRFDEPAISPRLLELARLAARKQIAEAHLPAGFDPR